MGLEAKTDRVDARLIARYGEVMRPAADAGARPGARRTARDPGLPPQLIARSRAAAAAQLCRARAMRARASQALALRQEAKELDRLLRAHRRPRTGPPTPPCSPPRPAAARSWPPPCSRRCPSWASSTAARSRASPASRPSPATAACASTAASSRAAAARSAAPSTWPPSPRASRPAAQGRYDPWSPKARPQARAHRPHAHHARHPQRQPEPNSLGSTAVSRGYGC